MLEAVVAFLQGATTILTRGADKAANTAIPFWQIANDGNLLPKPIKVKSTLIAMAERMDIVPGFRGALRDALPQHGARRPRDDVALGHRSDRGHESQALSARCSSLARRPPDRRFYRGSASNWPVVLVE